MTITHLLSGGIFDKMWYDAAGSSRQNDAPSADENGNPSLEMKHLLPSFVLWIVMLLMSLSSFLIEMCCSLCSSDKQLWRRGMGVFKANPDSSHSTFDCIP